MKSNLGHLMVDLETLGTKVNSVIVSIGAVEFDIVTGKTGREFFQEINIDTAVGVGLVVDEGSIKFWLSQSEAARMKLVNANSKNITEVLHNFRTFLQDLGTENLCLWGNSARFDLGCLNNAYNAIKREIPWYFRNERDVRTLVAFAPEIKKNMIFEGIEHDPIDDCKFQIKYCSKIWNTLQNNNINHE